MEEGRTNVSNIVIAILVTIIVILVIAFVRMNQNRPLASEEPRQEQPKTPEGFSSPDPAPVPNARAFNFITPEDWEFRERAEEAVQEIAEGQVMTSGVILDPVKEHAAYFATYAYDDSLDENLLSVYSYDTEDDSWERIFRATYGEGDFPGLDDSVLPVMRAVGYENGKLILHVFRHSAEPDTCEHPILVTPGHDEDADPRERIVAMNLADPYNGFTTYEPSEEAVEEAEKFETECE